MGQPCTRTGIEQRRKRSAQAAHAVTTSFLLASHHRLPDRDCSHILPFTRNSVPFPLKLLFCFSRPRDRPMSAHEEVADEKKAQARLCNTGRSDRPCRRNS